MDESVLSNTALFRGFSPGEIREILSCLGAEQREYEKGQNIFRAGEIVTSLGIVLSGKVLIESCDLWGTAALLDSIEAGQIFAETYACVPGEPLLVNVTSAEPSCVLFLNAGRVLTVCSQNCPHHALLIRNLLTLSAQKNLLLSRKILYTSPKSIRGRVLSYLSDQAVRTGSSRFTIPFHRQQLADYLNVDRSALSNELSKLQREGVLKTERNYFELLGDIKL